MRQNASIDNWLPLLIWFPLLFLSACNGNGPFHSHLLPVKMPWEQYLAGLEASGLVDTRLAKAWRRVGLGALADSTIVDLPFRETGYFSAERPAARGYRLSLQAGEVLHLQLGVEPDSTLLFVDFFRIEPGDSLATFDHEFNADRYQTGAFRYEAAEPGLYQLRLQPELLVSCRYTLDLLVQPAYGVFPVQGKSNPDVWSFWGDPRDGGRRQHEGIDIFAPRGTPVLATTVGIVRRVRNRGLGGKQVWLTDPERKQALYYAHLDSQLVGEGQRVLAGDTLGLVGNTGNASGTRPHLHFGIYRRGSGPIDPLPFIAHRPEAAPRLLVDTAWLGKRARVRGVVATLRAGPGRRYAPLGSLPRHLPLRILAGGRDHYLVETPAGATGYLPAAALEPADRPLRQLELTEAGELLEHPSGSAPARAILYPPQTVGVLGQQDDFLLVRSEEGLEGWKKAK